MLRDGQTNEGEHQNEQWWIPKWATGEKHQCIEGYKGLQCWVEGEGFERCYEMDKRTKENTKMNSGGFLSGLRARNISALKDIRDFNVGLKEKDLKDVT